MRDRRAPARPRALAIDRPTHRRDRRYPCLALKSPEASDFKAASRCSHLLLACRGFPEDLGVGVVDIVLVSWAISAGAFTGALAFCLPAIPALKESFGCQATDQPCVRLAARDRVGIATCSIPSFDPLLPPNPP